MEALGLARDASQTEVVSGGCSMTIASRNGDVSNLPFELEMVFVPAASFLMGTLQEELEALFILTRQEKADFEYEKLLCEIPQHKVYLRDYEIARYPITNAEYAGFVTRTGRDPLRHWGDLEPPDEIANHPVVNITWLDAVAYCEWLSEETGRLYRLPTEAEWEKAARGVDGLCYPWGNEWKSDACNNISLGHRTTTAVGIFSPLGDSPWGCADMIGNVWEWCSSRYGGTDIVCQFRYPYSVEDWREDMQVDDSRILRGGSFHNGPGRARCAYRGRGAMSHRNDHTGFRCVRNV